MNTVSERRVEFEVTTHHSKLLTPEKNAEDGSTHGRGPGIVTEADVGLAIPDWDTPELPVFEIV